MWLLIDDERDLQCDVIARTAEAGKKMLAIGGWEVLCLDHDLGDTENNVTGYDICKWAIANDYLPNEVQLVTSNPVGRENIAKILLSNGYKTKEGIDFIKA